MTFERPITIRIEARATRSFWIAVVLLLVAAAPARAQEEAPVEEARAILASLDDAEPSSVVTAAERLADLGSDALPILLDLWWTSPRAAGDDGVALERTTLEQAIARHDHAALRRALEEALGEAPSDDRRLLVLRALAHLGDNTDLDLALRAATGFAPGWARSISVVRAWSKTLETVYPSWKRMPSLRSAWSNLPASLRVPMVGHIAERGSLSDVRQLVEWIGHDPADVAAMLREVDRAPRIALAQATVQRTLREYLGHPDRKVRSTAATILGRTGGARAFPELVDLLEDRDARVRTTAHTALQAISHVTLDAVRDAWLTWYEDEEAWLEESDLDTRLEADDTASVAAALQSLVHHPVVVVDHLPAIVELLADERPELRALACTILQRLGDVEAVVDLVELLEDPEASVQDAAWRALVAITGTRHPPDRKAWKKAIDRWRS